MTERNYLNVQGTLPDAVTMDPAKVAAFVRERGGSIDVQSHPSAEYRDDPAYAHVTIKFRVRLSEEDAATLHAQKPGDPQPFASAYLMSWSNLVVWASYMNTVEEAHRVALLKAWAVVVEIARWKHAQDAVAAVL